MRAWINTPDADSRIMPSFQCLVLALEWRGRPFVVVSPQDQGRDLRFHTYLLTYTSERVL